MAEEKKKKTWLAYVFWLFLGWFGGHQFYLGKIKRGGIYLTLTVIFILTLWFGFLHPLEYLLMHFTVGNIVLYISMGCFGVVGIFLLIDLFTLPKQIRKLS